MKLMGYIIIFYFLKLIVDAGQFVPILFLIPLLIFFDLLCCTNKAHCQDHLLFGVDRHESSRHQSFGYPEQFREPYASFHCCHTITL